ncbi:MAG: hypothetical protein DRN28_07175 [Thermoplasmata archaeon]|nr:MAG: hypothetical protein DRN28_07175 [Thermoplasmata archaeon]
MEIYNYIAQKVGPTFFLLYPLGVISLAFLVLSLLTKEGERFVRFLTYSRNTAPQLGLLGSVLGLSMGMRKIELGGGEEMFEEVIHLLGNCFLSTVYGILISLVCSLACWREE